MAQENAYFIVNGIDSHSSLNDVRHGLCALYGVQHAAIDPANHLVAVEYDSSATSYDIIENRLNKMGYEIAADASTIQIR